MVDGGKKVYVLVAILIIMDKGFLLSISSIVANLLSNVAILIIMDKGFLPTMEVKVGYAMNCRNPYYNG